MPNQKLERPENKPSNNGNLFKKLHEMDKLIRQINAKIDLIKGCVMRLEQKVKSY